VKHSLPHVDIECQRSVNDRWLSIMVNHRVMWPLWSIYIFLTVFVWYKAQEYSVVALSMKSVVTVPEDVVGISHTYLPIKAAISVFMDACDQSPLIIRKMPQQKSLTLCKRSFSKWGRERFSFSFGYNGGEYCVYDCV